MIFDYPAKTLFHISFFYNLDRTLETLSRFGDYEGFTIKEELPSKHSSSPKFQIKDLTKKVPIENIKFLEINGFLSNPSGIEDFKSIERMLIASFNIPYKEIVDRVGREQTFFKIDLTWYPKLTELNLMRVENIVNLKKTKIRSLILSDISFKELQSVKFPISLTSLSLIDISRFKDLSFIADVERLEKLKLGDLKLDDLSPIYDAKNLKELFIKDYKNIDIDTLKSNTLKKLTISKRGTKSISSLKFMKNLPNLEEICIECNIADKDLTPLIEHSNLKVIKGYLKGYDYTIDEIISIRANRFS